MKTFVMDMLGLLCVAIAMLLIMFSIFGCNKTNPLSKPKPANTEVRVVAFTASWCGPCKRAIPILIAVRTANVGVDVQIIDIDKHPQLAEKYGVKSVPHFLVFNGGRLIVSVKDVNVACFIACGEVRRNRQ